MNQDFHYEGTYSAAKDAGFSPSDASVIAHAAQMVDDCSIHYLKSIHKMTPDSVITAEWGWDNVEDFFTNFADPTDFWNHSNPDLNQIRRIWMPFHFLPGNLELTCSYQGPEKLGENKFSMPRDEFDMKTMCLPCSELVQLMIEHTRETYQELSASPDSPIRANVLALIGIRMHVLADTWAHSYFAGTPSKWVNNATDFSKITGTPDGLKETGTPDTSNVYSVYFLGHARAGHYPDYGSLIYQYHPQWMRENSMIIKCGPDDFMCAYTQMVQAMTYIRDSAAGSFSPGSAQELLTAFNRLPDAPEVEAVIKTKEANQANAWREELVSELTAYDKSDVDMDAFQAAARIHLYLVKNYLEQNDICYL